MPVVKRGSLAISFIPAEDYDGMAVAVLPTADGSIHWFPPLKRL